MSDPSTACSLKIAGITSLIQCDDCALLAGLRQRYAACLTSDAAQFRIQLRLVSHSRASSPHDTEMLFRDGVLYFIRPDYQGEIALERGRAELRFSSLRPVEDVDYFLRICYALLAFQAGGLLFHSAGVVRGEQAYLFFGHSGSGKTTVARLSPGDRVLNDDLLILLPSAHGWMAHTTPFWNPTQVKPTYTRSAPLAGLFRLVQDRSTFLEAISPGQALAELIANAPVLSGDPGRSAALLARCRALSAAVPVYRLHFLQNASFWPLVEAAIAEQVSC